MNSHKNNIRVVNDLHEEGAIINEKMKVRCRHWPKCNLSDLECPYIHPKEECPFFPKCTFGEKCIMIHPDIQCKFGTKCTRDNCSYKHPKGKISFGGMPGMGMLS